MREADTACTVDLSQLQVRAKTIQQNRTLDIILTSQSITGIVRFRLDPRTWLSVMQERWLVKGASLHPHLYGRICDVNPRWECRTVVVIWTSGTIDDESVRLRHILLMAHNDCARIGHGIIAVPM